MEKELGEKFAKMFMFVETSMERKNGKCTHLLSRKNKQELSLATGKPINSHRDWDAGGCVELIPGIDYANFIGANTRFADLVWSEIEYYNQKILEKVGD